MTFTVAIIGRPNVGKSTLFNRLIGKKEAIVYNTPGVTRDWREGEASLGPLEFRVIDTAGLEEPEDSAIETQMLTQTEQAISHSDVLLMVVDGREGITPVDEHFASWARKKDKPVLLAMNKCEGNKQDTHSADAYALGFGEPVAISAEHGLGLAELYDAIAPLAEKHEAKEEMPEEEEEENEEEESSTINIAIAGRPNVGKSTLLNQLVGEERSITSDQAGTTRDAIHTEWEYKDQPILLVDTAGMRKKANVQEKLEKMSVEDSLRAIQYANIVVLVLDATQALEKQDLTIADHVIEEGRGLVIAVNKWDLVENPDEVLEEIRYKLEKSLYQAKGVPVVTLSALKGKHVTRIIDTCINVFELWNMRISTGKLNSWLETAAERHPPPLINKKPLRLRYMTQHKTRPPTFSLFTNSIKAFPEHYLRYLTNNLRETFNLHGTPIRILLKKNKNPYVKK